MELTKEQMKRVIEELESSYETKMLEDKFLEEIINLFKKYLNSGETKWLLQKLEKTNSNYLFKNLGGYSMDSKTENIWSEEHDGLLKEEIRNKIVHRCEILKYMGDDGVHPLYYQLNDKELVEDCGWVLEEGCDFCDKYELGLTERT